MLNFDYGDGNPPAPDDQLLDRIEGNSSLGQYSRTSMFRGIVFMKGTQSWAVKLKMPTGECCTGCV